MARDADASLRGVAQFATFIYLQLHTRLTQESDIVYDLVTVSIDDNPQFEAPSYVWGLVRMSLRCAFTAPMPTNTSTHSRT
jgi:hypothetical protein